MDDNIQPRVMLPDLAPLPQVRLAETYGETSRDIHFRDYWDIVRKRKLMIFLFFFGTVAVVGLITFLMTPLYRASAILQITQDNPAALMGERDPFSALYASETQGRFYETQYMLISSRTMAYKIIDRLELDKTREYKKLSESMKGKSAEEIRSKFAQSLLADLEVKPLKKSYLVEVAYQSPDKNLAQKVVNIIASEYMKFSMDTRRQSYALIRNWLEGELQLLASKVEESERKLYANGREKDFLSLEDSKDNVTIGKYVELSALLTKAQVERLAKEALYHQIKGKGADASPITNNTLIQRLRSDLIDQEAKVASLSKIYDVNYPQLQAEKGKLAELRSRLGDEVKRLRTSIESDYEAALRTENLLRDTLSSQKTQVGDLQESLVKHHILKRDMQTNEQLYQALLARMKETSVAGTMVASNVAVTTPAELPYYPYKPKKRLNMLLSCFFGLVGGVGLAFVAEYFDDSIKTSEEMERTCHLAVLGVVPLLLHHKNEKEKAELSLVTYTRPKSIVTEAIRHVRTSVMLSVSGGPPRAIMVASPNPGEGKTTLAINLAIALASNDRKVVLLDCDLRKPTIHKVFGQALQPGISNYLTGSASLNEILRSTEIPHLFFIPGGTLPPSPVELVSSKPFEELLLHLRTEFQHVIVDTPPLIEFADARCIANLVDGSLIVVRNHFTSRKAGSLARQLLTQVNAPVIGGVLNMATSNRLGYGGYYYGYSKYYSKYYKNYEVEAENKNFDT